MNSNLFENIFSIPPTLSVLLKNVKKQQSFLQENLEEELTAAKNENDGSLGQEDFKKILQYYGLAVPAILGEALCSLRGKEMTHKERLALTYQGAMTGLGDDFFDKEGTTADTVRSFIETPEKFTGHSANQRLFLSFYKKALMYVHDPVLVRNYLRAVFISQVESKKQAFPGLTKDEIMKITMNKGGTSVLFYRAALSHSFLKNEENALFTMGGLMQLGNDIFDIYKDLNHNINTLITTTDKIEKIRTIFKTLQDKSFKLTNDLAYSKRSKKKYLRLISMSICSRCYVFFDQLEEKEKQTGFEFKPAYYKREDLICDMDKRKNKIKTISYFLKQNI